MDGEAEKVGFPDGINDGIPDGAGLGMALEGADGLLDASNVGLWLGVSLEGLEDGLRDGFIDICTVGDSLGPVLGEDDATSEGICDGFADMSNDGAWLDTTEGISEGEPEDGLSLSDNEGESDGLSDILAVGVALVLEGAVDNTPEGVCEEPSLGCKEGISLDSIAIGATEGAFDGLSDDTTDGLNDVTSLGTALSEDGNELGTLLGGIDETASTVGVSDVILVGIEETTPLGISLGYFDETVIVGLIDGAVETSIDWLVGLVECTKVGTALGKELGSPEMLNVGEELGL